MTEGTHTHTHRAGGGERTCECDKTLIISKYSEVKLKCSFYNSFNLSMYENIDKLKIGEEVF